jgi:hypothetical protein
LAAFAGDGVGNTAPLKNIVEGVNDTQKEYAVTYINKHK